MMLTLVARFLLFFAFCDAMTMKQIRNTGSMMRKSCQPKNNVPNEKIDHINDGVFIDERDVKCYIACIMKMANTIKNGKLNFDAATKQVDLLLPEELKEPTKEAMAACRKVVRPHMRTCRKQKLFAANGSRTNAGTRSPLNRIVKQFQQ